MLKAMAFERNSNGNSELSCLSGSVTATVGETFIGHDVEWEILAFGHDPTWSGEQVLCKVRSGEFPSSLRRYAYGDGTMAFCDDSVAAWLLTKADGIPRSARGARLTIQPQA